MTMRRIVAGSLLGGLAAFGGHSLRSPSIISESVYAASAASMPQQRQTPRPSSIPLPVLTQNDLDQVTKWYNEPDVRDALMHPDDAQYPHTLYQMSTCPFCNKVRAFLKAHDIPFRTVQVDPISMSELKHSTYKKVPQLQVGGKNGNGPLLVDSAEIGTAIGPVLGTLPCPEDTEKWRTWSSDVLARYIAIEVGTNFKDSSKFVLGHPDLSATHKSKYLLAGTFMYFAAHRVVAPKLNALGYDTTDTRKAMLKEMEKWGERLEKQRSDSNAGPFHGGSRMSLADTDVYGVMQSVRTHAMYKKMIEAPSGDAFRTWLAEMDKAVGNSGTAERK